MYIQQDRCRPFGVHQLHTAVKHPFGRGLHRQIQRQFQRLAVIGKAAQLFVVKPFNPRNADNFGCLHALTAKGGAAHDMGRQTTVGIKPHLTRAKQQPRLPNIMHRLLLFGAERLAHPEEFLFAREGVEQLFFFQLREDARQFCGGMFRLNHVRRHGIKRKGF